jgi:hypothetical protein
MFNRQRGFRDTRRTGLYENPSLSKPFTTTWDTRIVAVNQTTTTNEIYFPIYSAIGFPYDFTIDWGDGTQDYINSPIQPELKHTYSTPGIYQVKVNGVFSQFYSYSNNGGTRGEAKKLISIDSWGGEPNIIWGTSHLYGFWQTSITSLPSDGDFFSKATSLSWTFRDVAITSLPENALFENLVYGGRAFYNTELTSLPSGMILPVLDDALAMFYSVPITELPSGMLLNNLVSGSEMFRNSGLTTLNSNVTLSKVTNGNRMFDSAPLLNAPSLNLASLTNGTNMFLGCTLNTIDYSNILTRIAANNPNNGITFHGGNSKYNNSGAIARTSLTDRGWIIQDGGPE